MTEAQFLSPKDVRKLNERGGDALAQWFQQLLRSTEPTVPGVYSIYSSDEPAPAPLKPEYVAMVLRETGLSLQRLGFTVPPQLEGQGTIGKAPWRRMENLILHAAPSDGLVIFRSLARAMEEESLVSCASLMSKVFTCVNWRIQAIEADPFFFAKTRTTTLRKRDPLPVEHAVNAFQVLSCTVHGTATTDDFDNTLEVIEALHGVGVQDFPSPDGDVIALHWAAYYCDPEVFQVFVSFFKEDIEKISSTGFSPLDMAASSPNTENVITLLEAGANPRPFKPKLQQHQASPLWNAVKKEKIDNVKILIATEAYSDADVTEACKQTKDESLIDQVQGLFASSKIKRLIQQTSDQPPPLQSL